MDKERSFLDRNVALNDDALETVAGGRYAFCLNCEGPCHCGAMSRVTYYGCDVPCTGCGGKVYKFVYSSSAAHYDGICRECNTFMPQIVRRNGTNFWRA